MTQKKENGKIALLKKLPKPEMSDVMGFSFARQYGLDSLGRNRSDVKLTLLSIQGQFSKKRTAVSRLLYWLRRGKREEILHFVEETHRNRKRALWLACAIIELILLAK